MANVRVGVSFLICALSAVGFSQIAKRGDAYVFRVKYTAGQVIKLVSVTTVENQGSNAAGMKMTAPMTLKVLGVSKGIANVTVTIGAGVSGKTPLTPPSTLTMRLDALNRSADKTGMPGLSMAMPEKPIKPGTKWTAILPVNMGGVIQRLDGRYVFAGMKKVNGNDVAVVTYSLTGFASGTGTLMLLTSDGSMYGNDTHISLNASGAIERVHTLVSRLK